MMIKRVSAFLMCVFIAFSCVGCATQKSQDKGKLAIVTTVFPIYDFARAICGSDAEIKMLIDAGTEVHSFDPSPSDIKAVTDADIFFYVGGESDTWVEGMAEISKANAVSLMKSVKLLYEDGEDEYDEHIWTSPSNAVKMIDYMCSVCCKADKANAEKYRKNADRYKQEINNVSDEIRKTVESSDNKFILVADRFPFKYFADEYGLSYAAAFGGCAASTDISFKTMAMLTDTVAQRGVKVAYYTELSNKNVANALSEVTGVTLCELHSAHNVTVDDFKSGKTYVDIMKQNLKALRKGL